MSKRFGGLLAVLASLALAVPATAAPSLPSVAGTTVITTTAPLSAVTVRVPREIPFSGSCFPESAIQITGTARAVVVSLVPPDHKQVATFFGRFPGRASFSTLCGEGASLAGGTYRLVVLHSPGTVRITLHLRGLKGTTTLPLRTARGAVLQELPAVSPYASTGGRTGSFAANHDLSGQGLVEVFGWMDSDTSAVATLGDCEVSGNLATLLPAAAAQAPGCPLGGSGQSVPSPKGPGADFHAGGIGNVKGGPYSLGYFFQSQASARSAGGLGVWVPYSS